MDIALFDKYYQTYNSENPEALREFYHDDVELVSRQGVLKGVEAILDTYRYLTSHFHDIMIPDNISINGDSAVVEITDTFTAKHDVEDFMGLRVPKGEALVMKLRGTYWVVDGKFKTVSIEKLD